MSKIIALTVFGVVAVGSVDSYAAAKPQVVEKNDRSRMRRHRKARGTLAANAGLGTPKQLAGRNTAATRHSNRIPRSTKVIPARREHLDALASYRAQGKAIIAVLGSADSGIPRSVLRLARTLGRQIGKHGYVLVNGACPGAPDEAKEGAKEVGGITAGYSSYGSRRAHERSGNPNTGFDVIQLSGLPPGLKQVCKGEPNHMGRELTMLERCDAAIFVRGRTGTLSEYAIALEFKKPVGILGKTGGTSQGFLEMVKRSRRAGKAPAAPVILDNSPSRLLKRMEESIIASQRDGHRGPLGDGDFSQ